MSILTKRWNDPLSPNDGWRILICRYRPRALKREDETWDNWFSQLGPSVKLHADAYGKKRSKPISHEHYKIRYVKEMQKKEARDLIICLGKFVSTGCSITLLCSSMCTNKKNCHRTILKKLILNQASNDKSFK